MQSFCWSILKVTVLLLFCAFVSCVFILQGDLESYHGDGTLLHLTVTFSHLESPGDEARYVHQEMKRKWEELGEWLLERSAVVYVCG